MPGHHHTVAFVVRNPKHVSFDTIFEAYYRAMKGDISMHDHRQRLSHS